MTHTAPEVHSLAAADEEEREGGQAGARALQRHREAASQALANRPGFDIANLTDEEFARGLERIKTRQKRMAMILDTVLIDRVHYGNPKTKSGQEVFPKPILYQAGAEELRNLFRLKLRHAAPARVIETAEYCSVTVTLGVEDSSGVLLAPRSASCNTMEKRFERRDGKGYTYKDAREMLHQCFAMAEKRAGALSTKEVTGANAFFAAEDEDAMREALGIEEAQVSEPWTDEQRKAFCAKAVAAGIKKRSDLEAFIAGVLKAERKVFQSDIPALEEALAARSELKESPLKATPADPYAGQEQPAAPKPAEGEKPAPATAAAAAPPREPGEEDELDLALDKEIADQEKKR